MPLFQVSVLKNYLKQQDHEVVSKAYKKYSKYFLNPETQENIRNSKEEEFQALFLNELFVKILGYTIKPSPNYNLTTEFKNETNNRKADGAIVLDGKAIGVVELKGTKTKDLESIRKQAFDYKVNNSGCVYVITSNFEKLRFYIEDSSNKEEFNLFTLSEEEFSLMYLCLQKDNILNNIPQLIKETSVVEEEKITKGFYKDYSLFKRELYRDLVKQNGTRLKNEARETLKDFTTDEGLREESERIDKNAKLSLFKKSQKLIDRFLFIFFAEDRGLLPPNFAIKIINDWKGLKAQYVEVSLYERFKLYFNFLDKGRKGENGKAEVYAYNGGLFKPDSILDSLIINDDLLALHTEKLAKYDFESQVDVNILGHIFENSLNEIESVNAQIEGEKFDKQKSKRKKDGVYYTPSYITKYIVENTLGKLCEEKKQEFSITYDNYKPAKQRSRQRLENLELYREWLLQLTICDPACGSGAFLNQALDFLIGEHNYIDELSSRYNRDNITLSNIEHVILENNIYGVDLNEESVEIAKLSLWLRTAQPRRKLNDLSDNIKCGNSLIDSKSFAGDKAFNWQENFSKVFAKGGFDIIIGNPPYVRAELLTDYINFFEKKYKVFHPASDLFAYFYELGSTLINKNGLMGYISNTFDKTTAGKVLRNYLTEEVKLIEYIDFTEVQIFEGATTYPVIIIANKKPKKANDFKYIKIPKASQSRVISIDTHHEIKVAQHLLDSNSWSFLSTEKSKILKTVSKLPRLKAVYGKCYYGVKTALNDAFIVQGNWSNSNHIKPILEGKEIKKWNAPKVEQSLILFKSKWTNSSYEKESTEEENFDALKRDFPKIMEHLIPFEERARKRYDKGDYWWELRNCAYYDLFDKPKIIFPNLQNSNKFCLDTEGIFVNAPAVFLPSDNKTLLCVLNSKIVWEFLKSICVVRSGGYIEVKPQYFEQIPIPKFQNEKIFNEKAGNTIKYVSDFQELNRKFTNYFTSSLTINKLTRKLENWHQLDFSDFIKELNKAIKVTNKDLLKDGLEPIPILTKLDEMEWMDAFETKKNESQALQIQINKTEKEIDAMVYELYGLTQEEIEIVEEA